MIFLLISISLSVLVPYINKIITDFNVMQSLSGIGQSIIDNKGLAEFTRLVREFVSSLGGIFAGGREVPTLLILLTLTVVSRFILGLGDMAFYHCVDMHLSSAIKERFRSSFVRHLGKAVKYMLCKMLFALPVDAALIALLYLVSMSAAAPAMLLFVPFLLVLAFVILYALRLALFSGWTPEILHSENK